MCGVDGYLLDTCWEHRGRAVRDWARSCPDHVGAALQY